MIRAVAAWLVLTAGCYGPARAEGFAVDIRPGPGQEAVLANCSVCHSLDYIRTNASFLTPDGWKAEVAKMRGPFGAQVDDASAEAILRYLVTNYGVPTKG